MTSPASTQLSPLRALRHPAWIACLLLLAANDHLFKGGGVLPGWMTGKLSDFAGLLVAPAMLALLMRARSRRVVGVAHVAIALGFTAVKTIPAATHACEAALSLVVTSRMWTDPTDLIALPMVAVSWFVLVPKMSDAPSASSAARVVGERGLAVLGAVACVATSQPYDPPPPGIGPDGPVVRNDGDQTLVVKVRGLAAGSTLDFASLNRVDSLPTEAQRLGAGAWVTRSIEPGGTANLELALTQAGATPSVGPAAAFVKFDSGQTFLVARPNNSSASVVAFVADSRGTYRMTANDSSTVVRELTGSACTTQTSDRKFSYRTTGIIPDETYTLKALAAATEACFRADVVDTKGRAAVVDACMPREAFPFQIGERLWFEASAIHSLEDMKSVDFFPTTIGEGAAKSTADIVGARVDARLDTSCLEVSDCAISAAASLEVTTPDGKRQPIGSGGTVKYTRGSDEITLHVASGSRPVIASGACTSPTSSLGFSVGLAAVTRPAN